MKLNYSKLGDYIKESKLKNKDSIETNLVGLSNEKQFTDSKANIIGTDLSKYKLITYNQFVYMPTTSRNGDKISIALFKEEGGIISSSYTVFDVDFNLLNPDYLMLWFERPEFDRYARYHSHGSVREIFSWEDMQNIELYVPPLEYQNKVVKIKNLIDNRIAILTRLNKNLLSIADAIYKKEFQNFDTYSEDELIASDFGLIPKNWHYKTLDEISDVGIGKTPPRKETWWFSEQEGVKWVSIKDLGNSGTYIFETSEYLTNEAIEKFNVKLIPINTVILSFKLTVGRIGITTEEMVTNEAIAHFKLSENSVITKEYLYLYLKNFNYEELGSTSSIAKAINSKIVKKIPILIPNNKINEFKDLFENLFNKIKSNQLEINKLTKLRDTLLPKLMSGEIDVSEVNCDLDVAYS